MFDLDKWKEIWATLRSNRLRTFLTAFGVFWGILMLMLMLMFGSSLESGSKRQMKGMATNLLFVWGQQTTVAYDGLPPGRGVRFKTSDIEVLRRLPGVEWLAPRLQLGGFMNNFTVGRESKTGSFTVMADYPEFKNIVAFAYEAGRFINERDIAENRKVCVIGKAVREQLFEPGEKVIGDYIKISGVYFQVVGVTTTLRTGQQGERDANTIFVPFTTLKSAFKMGDRVGFFAMTAKPGVDGPELERQVKDALRRQHRVAPEDNLAIGSFNMFVMFDKLNTVFLVLALLGWLVGGATLLAGVVGVSNIMLITVKERTKEIGVRKALGATPYSIVTMVMKESIILTAIAGLIGVAVGVGFLALGHFALAQAQDSPMGPPDVSLWTVMKAVGILVTAGALAGIMPASHAASIKPIEALRAE
ncbi:MAG: ABC transporter permease [Deltaproteobacteria bacterium]|nr:ABC transporter permease [Deltaproteobacteria bacterium]MCW5801856.1 ABC transporter permease [Deltaproteobacteria bacterium]